MAPGGRYDNVAFKNGYITYSDASTNATSDSYKCPCCGQPTKRCATSRIATPTQPRRYFFEPEKPLRYQPQDLTKTYHWKKKNVPKF